MGTMKELFDKARNTDTFYETGLLLDFCSKLYQIQQEYKYTDEQMIKILGVTKRMYNRIMGAEKRLNAREMASIMKKFGYRTKLKVEKITEDGFELPCEKILNDV